MALVYPGSASIPRYESSLAGLIDGLKEGQTDRKNFNAQQVLAGTAGTAPKSFLEKLVSGEGPFTRPTEPAAAPSTANAAPMAASSPVSSYAASVRAAESGGNDSAKNPNSSATGRYQFLDSTWNGLMSQYPDLGLTANGRTDPAQQERAMERFTQDNARVLAGAGVPVNPGNLYAAHFLGAGGASKVLTSDPSSPMSALVDPGVIEANPHLANMTAADFTEWAASKGGGQGGGYSAPMPYDQPSAGRARQFTPEELGTLLASEDTRPFAMSILSAQQQQGMNAGRFEVQEMPDGSIRQVDRLTGETSILQQPGGDLDRRYKEAQIAALEAKPASPLTDDQREYNQAVEQGYAGTLQDWIAAKPRTGTNVNINTGEGSDAALNKALSTKEGETWSAFKDSAATSASNAQDFEVLNELLQLAPQGPITGRLADTFKGFSAAGDAANSIIKRIAPTLRAPGSGATSDIEYQGMLQSLPSLAQNPEANAMVLSIMQAKAQINMARGQIVTAYQNGEMDIGEARRAMDELNAQSIMTPDMRRALLGLGGDGNITPAQDQPVGEGTVIEDDKGNQLVLRNGQWEPVT